MLYYIENGVRRAIVCREAGLIEIPGLVFEPGRPPAYEMLKLVDLYSPKTSIRDDARFRRIALPIHTPIHVQPLGERGQTASIPLKDVQVL
jgi:hypothetical protein